MLNWAPVLVKVPIDMYCLFLCVMVSTSTPQPSTPAETAATEFEAEARSRSAVTKPARPAVVEPTPCDASDPRLAINAHRSRAFVAYQWCVRPSCTDPGDEKTDVGSRCLYGSHPRQKVNGKAVLAVDRTAGRKIEYPLRSWIRS
jgi:hypothetical protein